MTDTTRCLRCEWTCPHVESWGIAYCPNCGSALPVPGSAYRCTYAGDLGCSTCGRQAQALLDELAARGAP